MSNLNKTTETEQFILNRVKSTSFDTLDVTPMVVTGGGTAVTPVSTTAPMPTSTINSDSTDNSYQSGGVYGQKVHVVGISDLHVQGNTSVGSSLTGIQPVATGFKDATGNNQFVLGDTTNGLWVNVKSTVSPAVTGTVTANQGTAHATEKWRVNVIDALPAGSNLIGKVTTDQTTHGTTDLVAADITKFGGVAAVVETTGEPVFRPVVKLGSILRTTQSVTATTSTAATNFGATASKRNYILGYSIWNSSAVDTFVRLQDGNGGSDFWIIPAPKGGGANVFLETPIPQPTTNTALYFAEGAAASTVYVSLLGFQAA